MELSPLAWFALLLFVLIFNIGIPIYVVLRLSSLDRNLEKVALLLTVLANKQGATQQDIENALSPRRKLSQN
ncbi:MAG: hypothetical protein ACOX9B_09355 [Candidatus Xenobium sp.]|jgi:hypothetical protein|nr:hypothetical protein [Burkholderiales bacterium]